jgi:predicted  nucleic acid-binding Zn-ribbon protein
MRSRKRSQALRLAPPTAPVDLLRTLERVTHEIHTLQREQPRPAVPTLGQQLARLLRARAAAFAQLPTGLRSFYRRLQARRRPSVALVEDGRCGGCRQTVPPAMLREEARGYLACPHCLRLLIIGGTGHGRR